MTTNSHKNMDRTSAAQAKFLDAQRERQKKRRVGASYDKSKPRRGGFRK